MTGFDDLVSVGDTHFVRCHANNAIPPATISWWWDGSLVNGRLTTTENTNGTFNTGETKIVISIQNLILKLM